MARKTKPPILPVYQEPLPLYDQTAAALETLIRDRLHYDYAVRCGRWRLAYVCPASGFVHYRLTRGSAVAFVVDVRSPARLPAIQRMLAYHLAALGFTVARTAIVWQPVAFGTSKWRLPKLKATA
jgi:hypothetical protein